MYTYDGLFEPNPQKPWKYNAKHGLFFRNMTKKILNLFKIVIRKAGENHGRMITWPCGKTHKNSHFLYLQKKSNDAKLG